MKKVISLCMLLLVLVTCSNGKKNLLLQESILAIASLNSICSTTNKKPSIPTNLVTKQTSTSITLQWDASTDSDGSITDYEVSKDNGTTWTSSQKALKYTFNSLTLGTTYQLQVKAKDNANAYSDVAKTRLTLGNENPSIPTNLVASQTSTSITLKWDASTDKDGTIADYEVSKDNGTTWESAGTDLTHTFTDLTTGTTYKLQVKAKDNENAYSAVAKTSLTLGDAKPTTPTNLRATFIAPTNDPGASGSITLTWDASTDSDGSITDYEVSKDNGANWVSSGTDLTHTFTGTIGTTYNLQVRAKDNKDTYSDVARTSLKLGNARPSTPTNFVANHSTVANAIALSWTASMDEGSISYYEVQIGSGTWISSGTDLTHTFTGLTTSATPYSLKVRAKDNEGLESNEATTSFLLSKVKKVALGGNHSFIETADNKLFVFGDNGGGQLGLGTRLQQNSPVELTNPAIAGKVKKVTLGANHSFIETTDNKLFVFGYNAHGQLGLGNTTQQTSPVELTSMSGRVKKVTLGGYRSFIETTDNKLFVFGVNGSGQLGLGDTSPRTSPTELPQSSLP